MSGRLARQAAPVGRPGRWRWPPVSSSWPLRRRHDGGRRRRPRHCCVRGHGPMTVLSRSGCASSPAHSRRSRRTGPGHSKGVGRMATPPVRPSSRSTSTPRVALGTSIRHRDREAWGSTATFFGALERACTDSQLLPPAQDAGQRSGWLFLCDPCRRRTARTTPEPGDLFVERAMPPSSTVVDEAGFARRFGDAGVVDGRDGNAPLGITRGVANVVAVSPSASTSARHTEQVPRSRVHMSRRGPDQSGELPDRGASGRSWPTPPRHSPAVSGVS
jgi:hypothetical protein